MYRAPSRHRVRILTLATIAGLLIAACTNDSPTPLAPPTTTDSQATSEPSQADPNPADADETETPDAPPDEATAVVDETDQAPNDAPPTDTPPDEPPLAQPPAEDTTLDPPDEPTEDPWASRRRDLLIELTDPADVELLAEFGATVGERRGLELLHEVPVYLLRRSDLVTYFNALFDESDIAEAEFEEATYRLLGIIGPDLDYLTLLEDLYVGLVLGFYDEDVDSFILVSDNDRISRRDLDTIAHEYIHALQDQHFDLGATFDSIETTDAATAFRFVVEGDARLSERLFSDLVAGYRSQLESSVDRLPGASDVPFLLRQIFNAPYIVGLSAVARIVDAEGPNAIDPWLAHPPLSTEQLLHPERANEPPITVSDPSLLDLLGAEWSLLGTDTIGEFVIRTLLAPTVGGFQAGNAAEGWGGDRLAVYQDDQGAELLAWNIHWDDTREATEFASAALAWLRGAYGGPQPDPLEGSTRLSNSRAGAWLFTIDDQTWLLMGTDADALDRAAEGTRERAHLAAALP